MLKIAPTSPIFLTNPICKNIYILAFLLLTIQSNLIGQINNPINNFSANHVTASLISYDIFESSTDDETIELVCNYPITISNTSITGCIEHKLRDVAELTVDVSWTGGSPSDQIEIQVGDKIEIIDVAGTLNSPQSIKFIVPANGASNIQIDVNWKINNDCATSTTFNAPSACSTNEITCDILYLCGLDKPYDGDPWDHGWIEYLNANNGSNLILPILTKNEAGMGTYDVMNQSTFVNLTLTDYDLIIVSATTEGHISSDLVNALKDFSGTVLLSNYLIQDELGLSSTGGDVLWGSDAHVNNTLSETLYNYDNPSSWSGKLFTHGDQYSLSDDYLWANSGDASSGINGILYMYDADDALTGVASTHGDRIYLGYHFNGIYANADNNGFLPSPASSWFVPENHLTLKGKEYFDLAISLASKSCANEICANNIDDDGDGLIDSVDPDCPQNETCICSGVNGFDNPGFESGSYVGNDLFITGVYGDDLGYNWGTPVGLDGWSHGPLWWIDSPNALEGTKLAYINNPVGGSVCQGQYYDLGYASNEISECATYQVCFDWASFNRENPFGSSTTSQAAIDFTWFDASDNVISASHIPVGTPVANQNWNDITWTTVSESFSLTGALSPPANTTYVRVNISENSGQDNGLLIDNTSMCVTVYCPEICDNGYDDDNDGYADCLDSDCDSEPSCPAVSCQTRVTSGLIALYDFNEGSGNIVSDLSGVGASVDLTILDTANITWLGSCGLSINAGTSIISDTAATKITNALKSSNAITIEAWVKSDNISQSGPTRIVSLSDGSYDRNITLGQETHSFIIRNRTSDGSTTDNGYPERGASSSVNPSQIQQVIYTFDATTGDESIYVNGIEKTSGTRLGDFSNWNDAYKLILGNESTNDRPFIGEIYAVAIYDKVLSTSEIIQNLNEGACCEGNPATEPQFSCEDGGEIELFYTGLKNDVPKSINFNNISNVDSVLVEIVYKTNNPGATIQVEDDNGIFYTATRISVGVGAYVYSVTIPATSSISYSNEIVEANAQSMSAYVYRSGLPGKIYASQFTVQGGYANIQSFDLLLPARTDTTDLNVSLPISELTYDNRILNFKGTAGSNIISFTKQWGTSGLDFPDGCCIDTVNFNFKNVPPSVSILNLEVDSPSGGVGQSYVIAGLVFTEIECYGPEICDDGIDNDGDGFTDCQDLDCGQIINNEFDDGTNSWFLSNQAGNSSTWKIDGTWQLSEANSAYFDISTTLNGTDSHIQFGHGNLSIDKDKTYAVYFDAKAVAARNINISIASDQAPYTEYANQAFSLTTAPQSFSFEFVATESVVNDIQLLFNLGESTANIWLDKIQIKELPSITIDAVASSIICGGESADLATAVSGLYGPITYQWQKAETDSTFIDITGAASSTLNTGILNATTYYKVIATSSNICSPVTTSASYKVTVKRNSIPASIAGPANICPGNTATLTVNENIETGNLIDYSTWTVGTGSNGLFYQNGSTAENHRILANDPWGNSTVVWEARPGSISNADGGWNSARVPVDNTKAYRFSVWVNRNEIGPDGRFYLGTRGYGTESGLSLLTSTSTTTNPYFYTSPTPPNFTEDEWYLVVGHVFSHDHAGTTKHPDSGIFTSNEGYVGPTTRDYKWRPGTNETVHRSYLYYATDTDIRQRWVYPRLDVLDGTEPTLDEMLSGFDVNGGLGDNATWEWYANSCGGTSVGSGKTVTVSPTATTTYYVRGEGDCGSSSCNSIVVTVSDTLKVAIDYDGNPCLDTNSKISAEATGGTGNFSYNWIGPNSYTSTQDTIDITDDGNYYVTVTDDDTGCQATTSGFIYEAYEPFIFTLNTTVCEGETVDLAVNSPTAVGFQWGATAANATSSSITVTPAPPSTTYFVTVTNDVGCQTEASATINVTAKPIVTLTGPNSICEGGTTTLSPTSGGIWVSSNNAVATVDNMGIVTGQSSGSATFSFKNNTTDCWSDESVPVTVTNNASITINGDNTTCEGEIITLTASVSGGTWSSSNSNVATVSNSGDVTAVAAGNVTISYVPANTGCYGNASHLITIYNSPTVSITGAATICEGQTTTLAPTSGGTWISGDITIATITNAGVVTGISGGNVFFTFTTSDNCSKTTNTPVTVIGDIPTTLNGPGTICVGQTTNLTPTSGGIWISSNNSVASVNGAGVVTAKANGTATFTFYEAINGCASNNTIDVTVNNIPVPNYNGPSIICIGDTTYIEPSANGNWTSTNPTVASVNNNGMIIGISSGNARFLFTNILSGCISELSEPLTVNPKPTTNLLGQTDVCVGSTITISPNSGGTWTSNNPTIASISNSGVITGLADGTASFYFTNSSTGCDSDATGDIAIHEPTVVDYSGPDEICEGSTTNLTPSTGGTWVSNNSNIATVSASGLITAIAPGTTSFVFTDDAGLCSTSPSTDFTVIPRPIAIIAGPNSICIGSLTYLTPTSGGIWTSSNNSVATISNDGTVTGIANGTAIFTFFNTTTGCISEGSAPVTVYERPIVNITGTDDICVGGSTTLTPSSGGTWTSSNTGVASITNGGIVTGHSIGTATFTYVENGSGCTSDPSEPINVNDKPTVSITGPNTLCIGSTSTLSPSVGGTWSSTNPAVATVTNSGIVTAVQQGIARFTFTTTENCVSDQTAPIIVYGKPTVFNPGPDDLCVGSTLNLLPSSGGTWQSSNTSVATISNAGLVTGIAQGTVTFIFTDSNTGCISDPSGDISVHDLPTLNLTGEDTICVGNTTQLFPTVGGLWYSNNPSIAIINNAGVVQGISAGTTTFYFLDLTTQCTSENSLPITIKDKPVPQYTGPTTLCVGETSNIIPSIGGTWVSDDPSIATIDNNGLITAIANGIVRFKFTEPGGCASDWSSALTVNGNPTVGFVGSDLICVDGFGQVYPTLGGQWLSLSPTIATIDNSGLITGVSAGQASFVFTSDDTGCSSDGSLTATILDPPTVTLVGDAEICMGYTTSVTAVSNGIWSSSDNRIAEVSNAGIITGKAPGKVMISFTDALSGCSSAINSVEITVGKCLNHDFNVTTTTLTINGDVSTNDNYIGVYMSSPTLVSKPAGSLPNIIVSNDGTYSFGSSTPGKYIYEVQVCETINSIGCPTTTLELTVLGNIISEDNPVNNLEFVTVIADVDPLVNSQVRTIDVISNDDCVKTLGCSIDNSTLEIISTNTSGVSVISNDKIDHYTLAGYLGTDTISYKVCGMMNPTNCSSSNLYVTVSSPSANNDIVAPDDFSYTMATITVTGNVMLNDSDPENDVISVISQGSSGSPISITEGEYYINSDGTYSFTPVDGFTGQLELVYTLCDDNLDQACTDATLHVLVFGDMIVNTRVYLGGALLLNNNETASDGRPLMRDDLRVNPYDNINYLPTTDPYSGYIGLLDLTASFTHVGPGLLAENQVVAPAVFNVTGQDAIVDWVFLELRDKANSASTFATRSALLQRDGDVVELDGVSHVRFNGIGVDSFYLVVRHRSHLDVMSELIGNEEVVDFTDVNTPVFNFGTNAGNSLDYTGLSIDKVTKPGYCALWAGDFDANGKVKFTNPNDDQNILFAEVLFFPNNPDAKANFDFVYGYFQGDFDMNGKAKFANPNDDKNMLFSQLLFYPLNINLQDNFDFFIQQVPTNE